MRRIKKWLLKRSQMQKTKILAERIIRDLEADLINQDGDYVTIAKRRLKWLIDLVRWEK